MALVALALLATAPMAKAESWFNIKAGGVFPTGNISSKGMTPSIEANLDAGFNGELEYGYNFFDKSDYILGFDIGLGYFHTSGDYSRSGYDNAGRRASASFSAKMDVVPLALGLVAGIHSGPWRLYGGAGIDLLFCHSDFNGTMSYGTTLSGSDSESDTVFGGHVKAGLSYDITDHVFLGAEAKYLFTGNADFKLGSDSTVASADLNSFMITALVGFRW